MYVYMFGQKSKENLHAKWLFLELNRNTQVWAFDMIIAKAKRIYILMIKVNKLFSFFSYRNFLKEIKNIFSVLLLSFSISY